MPRQKGAHTLSRGGMLAGRVVRRPRLCGLQGQVPGAYGGFVCQHHRRGQGADRYLLHFVECPEGRGVDPGRPPRHLRARPQPGRLHQEADRPREYGDLGRGVPCPRGVFARKTAPAQKGAPRSPHRRASRMPGLYHRGGRFRGVDGCDPRLLRPQRGR